LPPIIALCGFGCAALLTPAKNKSERSSAVHCRQLPVRLSPAWDHLAWLRSDLRHGCGWVPGGIPRGQGALLRRRIYRHGTPVRYDRMGRAGLSRPLRSLAMAACAPIARRLLVLFGRLLASASMRCFVFRSIEVRAAALRCRPYRSSVGGDRTVRQVLFAVDVGCFRCGLDSEWLMAHGFASASKEAIHSLLSKGESPNKSMQPAALIRAIRSAQPTPVHRTAAHGPLSAPDPTCSSR
jgi:hypothetical protein